MSYLGERDKDAYRGKLQRACNAEILRMPTYAEAKAALLKIHSELKQLNHSAARSLSPEATFIESICTCSPGMGRL